MRLSTINGSAFVDFSASGTLTPYVGDELIITDHSGHQLLGYIRATGTGETYGSQLLSNSSFNTTSSLAAYYSANFLVQSGGYTGNELQVTPTASGGTVGQSFTASIGMLLRNSVYLTKGTETSYVGFNIDDSGFSTLESAYPLPSSWTQYILYATADSATLEQEYVGGTSGLTSLFSVPSTVQVLTPSTTGVTIVSTAGGPTYNWTSIASGFSLNDSGGYMYTISVPGDSSFYASSAVSSTPQQVFYNGGRFTQVSNLNSLATGTWYWNASTSQVDIYNIPSGNTVEAGQRSDAFFVYGHNYITITGLALQEANSIDLQVSGTSTNVISNSVTASFSGTDGILYDTSASGQITSSTSHDSLRHGVDILSDSPYQTNVTGGIFYNNNNSANYGAGVQYTNSSGGGTVSGVTTYNNYYGLKSLTSSNVVFLNNIVHDNTYQGIDFDEGSTNIIAEFNTVYNSPSYGFMVEQPGTTGNTVSDNVLYSNQYGLVDYDTNSASNVFYNNTVYGSTDSGFVNQSNVTGPVVENNIFANNGTYGYQTDGSPATVNYDLVYGNTSANYLGISKPSNDINTNPLFVSTSTDDFVLSSSSPAIDAGLNLGVSYDLGLDPASTWPGGVILDNENSYGSGWDIGAYVYTQASVPSASLTSPLAGATVSSTITLSANASATSPASISSVQFLAGGSSIGTSTATSSSYTLSWNTASSTNGSTTLTVLATDNYANTSTASITVNVENPPIISSISATPSTTTVLVTWTTNTSASSSVKYGLTTSYGSSATSSTLVTSHSITLSGLTNGQAYHYQVLSTDAKGNTASSSDETFSESASTSTPPQSVSASAGNGNATISFSVPASNGGSSITLYTITSSPGNIIATTTTAIPVTISGLTNGQAYTFTVVATNGVGTSSPATSNSVTPTAPNTTPVTTVEVAAGGGGGSSYVAPIVPPAPAPSSTTPVVTSTQPQSASSLTTELQTLESELASLEAQSGESGSSSNPPFSSYIFTRNLSWVTGPDVRELQEFLISKNSGPAAAKLETHGTTENFGILTYNALVEFQKSVGITPASGLFGPITRAWVNTHE
jgi:hypothetical protein